MTRKKSNVLQSKISQNKIFMILTSFYLMLLLIVSSIACFFAYQQRKEELLSEINITYVQLERQYHYIIDNFWQIYMPIFEKQSTIHDTLTTYFVSTPSLPLGPFEKLEVKEAMSQMMMRDSQIQWIALYSEQRDDNYILFNVDGSFQEVTSDFPYLDQIRQQTKRMSIYGVETIANAPEGTLTFAICGGVPSSMSKGRIIAGYSVSSLNQIYNNNTSPLSSLNYYLLSNDHVVYDSSNKYDRAISYVPDHALNNTIKYGDKRLFVNAEISGNRTSVISYSIDWWEAIRYCHGFTLQILMIVLVFTCLSIFLYMIMIGFITNEVNVIRNGLDRIGENDLDYKIPTKFKQSGLSEIAESVNHMTIRLQENIVRAYEYQIKQREAELSELQSKFNPHFLYNSLEMLRSRCSLNNDSATAELITQLASIFRGVISSKTFIPIREELTFSKRYISLFDARYNNKVEVRYDIDTEILRYGIIRNVFQPLIENYFVHGFESSEINNYILFRGKSLDDDTILFTIEDNGSGMSDEALKTLNTKLHEPITIDTESYGLKNLHQRLKLFYGEQCGLSIFKNDVKGLTIKITMLKMTCEEYERNEQKSN